MRNRYDHVFRAGITVGLLLLISGPACAQNILSQNSVPHKLVFGPSPYFVEAQFVSPDGAGRLFVFNEADGTLQKYDATGTKLWTSAPLGITSPQGYAGAMAVTAGGVYLAGRLTGALPGQTSVGGSDVFLQKYDLNGVVLWTRQFGSADNDYVQAIAPDATGVYVIFGSATSGGPVSGRFIYRYDASGNQLWSHQYSGAPGINVLGAAADSTGVYIYGYNENLVNASADVVRKFDPAGNDLWTRQFGPSDIILGVAPYDQGSYVLFFPGGQPGYTVRNLDQTGSEIRTVNVAPANSAGVIVADSSGFYVAGGTDAALPGECYAGAGDTFVMRFDASGKNLWTREFGTAGLDRPAQISIGATSVDVTGFVATADTAFLTRIEKSSPPPDPSQPQIHEECVLNAANYLAGGVAPGEIVTISGSALGPSALTRLQVAQDGHIATALAGTRILFDGEPAPLLYVSGRQSSAIVPYDVAGKVTVNVQVEYNGVLSSAVNTPVFDSRPGIFSIDASGSGQAAVVNQDGTVNSPSNPAARGSVISIYATGSGLPQTPGPDDQITAAAPSQFKASAYISLNTDDCCDFTEYYSAQVLYYGAAPLSVPGLVQINAQLPPDVPVGSAVPLYFGLAPYSGIEQQVTIAIR